MAIEEPAYTLVKQEGLCSVRDYKSVLIIETVSDKASQNGQFGTLAGYIFGGNNKKQKIAMTAPVLTSNQNNTSKMIFVMPKAMKLEDAPKPDDNAVLISKKFFGKVAVIAFKGRVSSKLVQKELAKLQVWLKTQSYQFQPEDYYVAQFNPPWILGPFRRNEIWVPVVD